MKEKNLKLIMELIFIFILPLLLLCFSSSITVENNFIYDSNGNYEASSKLKKLTFDNSFIKFENDKKYINYLNFNQLVNLSYDVSFGTTQTINGMDITFYDGYIVCNGTATDNIGVIKSANIISGHKYINKGGKSNAFDRYDYYALEIINLEAATSNNDFYTITIPSGSSYNNKIIPIYVIDLTQMFGEGFEPSTIEEFNLYVNLEEYYPYTISEIIKYDSSNQISLNYKINYTIWGKIKNLLIDNLSINDSIILDLIICYTMLWFIMFVIWHFFYLFFDGLVHLFVDWKKRSE